MKTKTQSANKNHESGNRATLAALVNLRHLYATGLRFKGGTVNYTAEDLESYRDEYKQALKDHVHACRLVHEARRELLATGYEVPDHWLTVAVVPSFHNEERRDGASFTFGALDHQRLAAVCQEIYLAMLRIDSQAQESPDQSTPAEGTTKEPLSKDALNMRLMRLVEASPDFARNPSPTVWAKAVGASKSSVSATPIYKHCKKLASKTTKAKVQGFTEAHADNLGRMDEGLCQLEVEEEREAERQRLIAQSRREAQLEPSPVDDDPPGRPRRLRQYRS